MATTPSRRTVDPGRILSLCHEATDARASHALISARRADVVVPGGVRVRITTLPQAGKAIAALRNQGYHVRLDSRPTGDEFGEAILVTGWDMHALRLRAQRGEQAVRELVAAHSTLATDVISVYSDYVDACDMGEDRAAKATAALFHGRAAVLAFEIVTGATDPIDRATLTPDPSEAVPDDDYEARIRQADDLVRDLVHIHTADAKTTLELYRAYRTIGDLALSEIRDIVHRRIVDASEDELADVMHALERPA